MLTDPETGKVYDNESDLKKYVPSLYEENFGEDSDWYKEHKYEKEVESKMNKEITRIKDEEEGYVAPAPVKNKRKSRKNYDGSYKSSYRKYSSESSR